jgi:hypothetical protein
LSEAFFREAAEVVVKVAMVIPFQLVYSHTGSFKRELCCRYDPLRERDCAMLTFACYTLGGISYAVQLSVHADVAALIQACSAMSGFPGHIKVVRDDGTPLEDTSEKFASLYDAGHDANPLKRSRTSA